VLAARPRQRPPNAHRIAIRVGGKGRIGGQHRADRQRVRLDQWPALVPATANRSRPFLAGAGRGGRSRSRSPTAVSRTPGGVCREKRCHKGTRARRQRPTQREDRLDAQSSTDHVVILQICGVPPARVKPSSTGSCIWRIFRPDLGDEVPDSRESEVWAVTEDGVARVGKAHQAGGFRWQLAG
jgi:hypothetical protein